VKALGDSSKVFIGGMSQGCAMSLATFLMYKEGRLGGVVGASGAQIAAIDWSSVDIEMKRNTPICLYHGSEDSILSTSAQKSYQIYLKDKGIDYSFIEEEGLDHDFSEQECNHITAFLCNNMI